MTTLERFMMMLAISLMGCSLVGMHYSMGMLSGLLLPLSMICVAFSGDIEKIKNDFLRDLEA